MPDREHIERDKRTEEQADVQKDIKRNNQNVKPSVEHDAAVSVSESAERLSDKLEKHKENAEHAAGSGIEQLPHEMLSEQHSDRRNASVAAESISQSHSEDSEMRHEQKQNVKQNEKPEPEHVGSAIASNASVGTEGRTEHKAGMPEQSYRMAGQNRKAHDENRENREAAQNSRLNETRAAEAAENANIREHQVVSGQNVDASMQMNDAAGNHEQERVHSTVVSPLPAFSNMYEARNAYNKEYKEYAEEATQPMYKPKPFSYGREDGKKERPSLSGNEKKKRTILICVIIAAVVAFILSLYFFGVSRYREHLFPNTTIGGVDVSNMTADEADSALDVSDWSITIHDITGEDVSINQEQAGMSVQVESPEDVLKAQNPYEWPFHVFGNDSQSADRTVSFDTDTLEASLRSLDMVNADKRTSPVDASYSYDSASHTFSVTPETQGNLVDADKLINSVENALDGLNKPVITITQDMCIQPSVVSTNQSLLDAVNTANKWLATNIVYDIDDQDSAVTVDASVIGPWIEITNDNGTFTASLKESAIKTYLAKIGKKYDTNGEKLTITTPTGKTASVSGTESYTGWLTDEDTELGKLEDDIKNGRTDHREFSMKHRANAKTGADVWGTTYIEVDLSTQHLWYVKDGQVAEDFGIISGKSGYETPDGVSKVYSKETNTVLKSPWKDPETGEPTYETPIEVGLVISSSGLILIHSAPWQPASGFGNASYHINGGSHGCVNAPTAQTWDLYNTVPIGTPVVIHY